MIKGFLNHLHSQGHLLELCRHLLLKRASAVIMVEDMVDVAALVQGMVGVATLEQCMVAGSFA